MSYLSNISFRRGIGLLVLVLAILFGGTWATVKVTTDHLLNRDARDAARDWAQFITRNVPDLEYIASGEQPSTASLAFFQVARQSGQVFRYVIFNRDGYSQLSSDGHKLALVDLSEFNPDAARAIKSGEPVVDVEEGATADQPAFFAKAYVPVIVNKQPVAVVAAYVDETERRAYFYRAFLIAALSLCLMIGLAFLVPAIAWYQRTKEKQQADRRIRFLAHHDVLTGLENRAQLIEKLESALAVLPLRGCRLAVHFIDFDRFKEVNDTFGHDAGDFLLKTVAERLRSVSRIDDIVARLGGDEFVVIQTGVRSKDQAEDFARRLTSALTAAIPFEEHDILTTPSIGIALAPQDGQTSDRLLKSADLALYKAKADGRNCIRFFLPEMDAELQTRIELERVVRHAALHNCFELHYQPLFETPNHRLVGFEALIRLVKDDGTLVPPMVFIPIAEDLRLIGKIGAWVLQEACSIAATWPEHLTVAVNLSPAQFQAGKVSDIVAATLKKTGLAARRLELEITETLLLGDSEAILSELHALKAMGVAIVMDDFGTGYSSLSYLWRFPFDKIKIDRSFMQAFDGSGRDAETVVKTIIALGRELNMRVTVEGVETAKQAAFLDLAESDQAQGFFFGRPIPAVEVSARILADYQKTLVAQPLISPKAKSKLPLLTHRLVGNAAKT